jgi:hypothetical protein
MSESIQEIQKDTFRYYYQDGLVELAVGILFLVIGLDTWAITRLPAGTPLSIAAWVLLPILTVGGIFGVQRFVKYLKERFVHPRTGYIEYAARPNRYRWSVAGFSLALLLAIILLPIDWLQKGSVTGGTILFIILAAIGYQVSVNRLIALGVVSLVLGVAFGISPLSDNASLAAVFSSMGLILCLTGTLAFRNYLAKNPPPQEGVHD